MRCATKLWTGRGEGPEAFSSGGGVSKGEQCLDWDARSPASKQRPRSHKLSLTPYSSKYDVQQRFGMDFASPRSGGDATELFPCL
jgi:hypothetical protein